MKKHKVLIIVGVGALGLYAFYRYRRGLPIFPGFGSALAGQGTAGSNSVNPSFGGSTGGNTVNLPTVPAQTMSEAERIRLRNLGTGPLSRSQCLINVDGRRWIDTQTAPYYGLCVTQANFTRWMNSGYNSNSQPTLDYVKRFLGL